MQPTVQINTSASTLEPPELELQLHTLVFFKNCSDLVLLGGRRFNIRGALQRGLELTDDIDYCEPISS